MPLSTGLLSACGLGIAVELIVIACAERSEACLLSMLTRGKDCLGRAKIPIIAEWQCCSAYVNSIALFCMGLVVLLYLIKQLPGLFPIRKSGGRWLAEEFR